MSLPSAAGVSFKPEHFEAIRATAPDIGFFEVHAENYMGAGGLPHAQLSQLRDDYALSLHGVGLSIGGADNLNAEHLERLKVLCDRYQPDSFSEHLAWSSHGGDYLNDLLPLPYTDETLVQVCRHVAQVQDVLGRRMLLENPSTYVLFDQSTIPETEFLAEVVQRTGCGLLLDVNNVFVSATNHQTDALAYLAAFPLEAVGEIHLGGHNVEELPSGPLLIDAHGSPVADPVWALYFAVLGRTGLMATLIEWDNDVPDWPVLMAEATRAQSVLDRMKEVSLERVS
ncbi:MNIO family bufferin maturase [Roseovarius sp. D0-M9]|uniref:MNIO family bufferin maturase n=1 Tax=Roseovarius sp. D0-M9 TaxID=3127117 RepID=UPI00300FC073